MGERAGILGKLARAQGAHRIDALDGARALVAREFLVAKDGEAFLQAELEPVAAGDAVAGPVVEVFMRDDGLDMGVIAVRRGFLRGEDVFVVEDVEALVLHGAHVEVGDGDDVEHVEIIFPPEDLLVPAHGALQRIERVVSTRFLAALDIDGEIHFLPAHCHEIRASHGRGRRRQGQTGRKGLGCGSSQTAKWRPPDNSPEAIGLPLPSSTGASARLASMRVV